MWLNILRKTAANGTPTSKFGKTHHALVQSANFFSLILFYFHDQFIPTPFHYFTLFHILFLLACFIYLKVELEVTPSKNRVTPSKIQYLVVENRQSPQAFGKDS